jgi:hypothetical protein
MQLFIPTAMMSQTPQGVIYEYKVYGSRLDRC